MKGPILLSVIIPAYNVERFIVDCLNSVLEQINNNIELIIINDGSTDCTKELIADFIEKNTLKNITLFSQINLGISCARNAGLKLSTGKYITFLDSDDVWNVDYISSIWSYVIKENVDIIEYDGVRFFDDQPEVKLNIIDKSLGSNYEEVIKHAFIKSQWYLWSRIYKKELFYNLTFPAGRRYEDSAILPYVYLKAKSILTVDKPLVKYRFNSGSIVNNLVASDFYDLIENINEYLAVFGHLPSRDKKLLMHSLLSLYIQCLGIANKLEKTMELCSVRVRIIKSLGLNVFQLNKRYLLLMLLPLNIVQKYKILKDMLKSK